jgi:hypothetical protein
MTEEELFDMIVPPGVPKSILYDVVEKYDVEVVRRSRKLKYANLDGDNRELLAFRGKKEVVEEVQEYLLKRLNEFVNE